MLVVRVALFIAQIIAIPVLAITILDLSQKALDAYNAERATRNLPALPEETDLERRRALTFLMHQAKTSTLMPEARRRVRQLRFWMMVGAANMILLAISSMFLR